MGSSVITPEDVLLTLMNDGTIDAIRLKIINKLKANEELKNTTMNLVEQSKVLNTPGAEKQTKRELFDALRQELEAEALEKASKSVWELILDNDGVGKEINETVERVFCQLSGRDPPLFPPSNSEAQEDILKEKRKLEIQEDTVKEKKQLKKEKVKVKGKKKLEREKVKDKKKFESEKQSTKLGSSSKKRNFGEMSMENSGQSGRIRCRRTDGKNWQCSMDAIPDSKYCEKHSYRGSRAKKKVQTTTHVSASNIHATSSIPISTPPQPVTRGHSDKDGDDDNNNSNDINNNSNNDNNNSNDINNNGNNDNNNSNDINNNGNNNSNNGGELSPGLGSSPKAAGKTESS